jgi:hypothetical protein
VGLDAGAASLGWSEGFGIVVRGCNSGGAGAGAGADIVASAGAGAGADGGVIGAADAVPVWPFWPLVVAFFGFFSRRLLTLDGRAHR